MIESSDVLTHVFQKALAAQFTLSLSEIQRCVKLLSEAQMQERQGPYDNSIVNLIVHIDGNIRQWVLHGIRGSLDVRDRDAEFALDLKCSGRDKVRQLEQTIREAKDTIGSLSSSRMMEVIDPQPTSYIRQVPAIEALVQVAAHCAYHAGQVVSRTKQLLKTDLDLSIPRRR